MNKIKEEDIRPKKIFDQFLDLLKEDGDIYFKNSKRVLIDCPCCRSKEHKFWLSKEGFDYQICKSCHTIYQSPRPLNKYFKKFYEQSKSVKFWASNFYKETIDSRVELIWKPKAKLVLNSIIKNEKNHKVDNLIDVGGGYGLFCQELNKLRKFDTYVIEPSKGLAKICREKGFSVIESFAEDVNPKMIPEGRSCFVSFELLEHVYNPIDFIQHVYSLMKSNDILVLTTLNGMGLDILHLKDKSKSISPPQHINFLNPNSLKLLLSKTGFSEISTFTPGKLDIDILLKSSDDYYWNQISNYLGKEKLQKIISENNLSSHMMTICLK